MVTVRRARRHVVVFVVTGVVTILAAAFLKLAESVRETDLVVRTDQHVLNSMVDHRVAWLSDVARVVTQFGGAWVVTVVIAFVATVLMRRRRYLDAGLVTVSSVGTAIITAIVKQIIGRPRPPGSHLVAVSGAAFPSGHAAQSVACYGAGSRWSSCSRRDQRRCAGLRASVPRSSRCRSALPASTSACIGRATSSADGCSPPAGSSRSSACASSCPLGQQTVERFSRRVRPNNTSPVRGPMTGEFAVHRS